MFSGCVHLSSAFQEREYLFKVTAYRSHIKWTFTKEANLIHVC
jgi:hypothetical protein